MDSDMPMILPKGIVINTPNIYDEVASFKLIPTDKVWQYWRVYTTTNKRLQDPTARRLENFWWHILGSDRCRLSGPVVARLYKEISLGPTFVPLRGPPNRWEGPDITSFLHLRHGNDDESTSQASSTTVSTPNIPMSKDMVTSALRPPPPHPILKKPRGPSTTGPRPTARFVSPHASEDEAEKEDDIPSSGSTITPGLEMRAAIKSPPKKKVTAAGRKFVASKGKRRPMLARKTSSYSSAGPSEVGTKAVASSSGPKSPHSFPQAAQTVSKAASTPNEGVSTLADDGTSTLSAKALGKRPAAPRRAQTNVDVAFIRQPKPGSVPSYEIQSSQPPLATSVQPQKKEIDPLTRHQSLINLPSQSQTKPSIQRQGRVGNERPSISPIGSVPMASTRSHSGFLRRERGFNHGLFTGATASTTNVAAHGTIIDQSGSVSPLPIVASFDQRVHEEMSASPSSSLLASRLTPTQPSTAPIVPLGRTRSQLTLLLERENERSAKKGWSRG